jgi:heat shock protein HtpX
MSLFLLVNIAVMLTISFIIKALNLEPYLQGKGINYWFLLGFCLIWGMGGAFISLMLSKFMAKTMMGLIIIDPNTTNSQERQLINMVSKLCMKAELKVLPEVAIYPSDNINAFATGPSRNNALVAVSTGLLNRMNQKEVEGVLGHEIAHIANGDMVTMTLLQGVVNAFAMFLSRIVATLIMRSGKDDDRRNNNYFLEFFLRMALEMAFMVLGSLVVRWFSRYREYRADCWRG